MKDTLNDTLLWAYMLIMTLIATWLGYLLWPVSDVNLQFAYCVTMAIVVLAPPALLCIYYN